MLIDIDSCHEPLRMPVGFMRRPLILYIEPNGILQLFMKDMFDLAGWRVRCAHNIYSAEACLRSDERYALLLTCEELPPLTFTPGRSGLELVTLARQLPHRKDLPILFFSIEDCEQAAKQAGANEFLRKPHDLFLMVDTIRRLIVPGDKK